MGCDLIGQSFDVVAGSQSNNSHLWIRKRFNHAKSIAPD
jgi:hypothetical protein